MVYILLADGFEEIEALTPIDYLRRAGVRRAGIKVSSVGITGKKVIGTHKIEVTADLLPEQVNREEMDMLVLPGGMPGTTNLEKDSFVQDLVAYAVENKIPVAAICAAPQVLGHKGYLKGKRAVCYPGFESELLGAKVEENKSVVIDGNFITAKSAGVAGEFSLALVRALAGEDTYENVREALCLND